MECVEGWVDVFVVVLRMTFGVGVSVVVLGEWALDAIVGVSVWREMRGLREAFVWALMSWEELRE